MSIHTHARRDEFVREYNRHDIYYVILVRTQIAISSRNDMGALVRSLYAVYRVANLLTDVYVRRLSLCYLRDVVTDVHTHALAAFVSFVRLSRVIVQIKMIFRE